MASLDDVMRADAAARAFVGRAIEKGFVTPNVTTLIAAIVLFNFGTGPIKGFAVTLSIGILTSMFTSIVLTRGLVNFFLGGKKLRELSI